jgi:hypothetical protein
MLTYMKHITLFKRPEVTGWQCLLMHDVDSPHFFLRKYKLLKDHESARKGTFYCCSDITLSSTSTEHEHTRCHCSHWYSCHAFWTSLFEALIKRQAIQRFWFCLVPLSECSTESWNRPWQLISVSVYTQYISACPIIISITNSVTNV